MLDFIWDFQDNNLNHAADEVGAEDDRVACYEVLNVNVFLEIWGKPKSTGVSDGAYLFRGSFMR